MYDLVLMLLCCLLLCARRVVGVSGLFGKQLRVRSIGVRAYGEHPDGEVFQDADLPGHNGPGAKPSCGAFIPLFKSLRYNSNLVNT